MGTSRKEGNRAGGGRCKTRRCGKSLAIDSLCASHPTHLVARGRVGGDWRVRAYRLGKGEGSETSENGTFRSRTGLARSLARSIVGVWHMALIAKNGDAAVELRRCRLSSARLRPNCFSTKVRCGRFACLLGRRESRSSCEMLHQRPKWKNESSEHGTSFSGY